MTSITETTVLKIRKTKKTTGENYFDVREENAVRLFLTASTFDEKNKIYNEFLRHPLDKMISSIIRRYKLYRKDMDFIEIHNDTHSFLMTKIDKFKPSKEKKAYSYFGTICKNYLMGQILKDQKEQNRKISYEDISSDLENDPNMVYYIDEEPQDEFNVIPIPTLRSENVAIPLEYTFVKVANPTNLEVPLTSKISVGTLVPIPTRLPLTIKSLSSI